MNEQKFYIEVVTDPANNPSELNLKKMTFYKEKEMKNAAESPLFEKLGLKSVEQVSPSETITETLTPAVTVPKVDDRFYSKGQELTENTVFYIVIEISTDEDPNIKYKQYKRKTETSSPIDTTIYEKSLTEFNKEFILLSGNDLETYKGGKRKSRRRIPHKKSKRAGKSRHLRKFGGNTSKMH